MSTGAVDRTFGSLRGGHGRYRAIFLIVLLFTFFWPAAFSGALRADQKTYPGLAGGLETMSAYSGAHPMAGDAYRKLVERAPENVRDQVRASDWAERQRNMTADELDAAVEDSNMRIIPTADGLATVPAEKLESGIDALTDFAIDQEETAALIKAARDRIPADRFKTPEDYQDFLDKADKIAAELDDLGKGGDSFWKTGKRTLIKTIVAVAAKAKIDQLSSDIKSRIIDEGAGKVLDEYRDKAAERKRKAAEQLAKARAAEAEKKRQEAEAEKKRQEAEAAKARAAADTAAQKANLDNIKQKAGDQLNAIEKSLNTGEALIAQCGSDAAALPNLSAPANIDQLIKTGSILNTFTEEAINKAQRVADGAEALKKFITQAEQAAAKICSATKASSDPAAEQRLGTIKAVARGVRDGIRGQIDSGTAALQKPVDRGNLQAHRDSLKTKQDYCRANKDIAGAFRKKQQQRAQGFQAGKHLFNQIQDAHEFIADINRLGGGIEAALMKVRFAQLKSRMEKLGRQVTQCMNKARAADESCKAIATDTSAARIDKRIAELDALEKRRKDALQRLTKVRGTVEQDYNAAKQAVARGKACVGKAAGQASCDPKEIETVFNAANADYYKANFTGAKDRLQGIRRTYSSCPGVPERVAKGEGLIDTLVNAKTRISTAIANCDVPKMESYIAQMQGLSSPHPSMAAWIANMRAKLPDCRSRQVAEASADCRDQKGGGYKASVQADGSYYCVPDKAAADDRCRDGWYAGPISASGGFSCYPGKQARTGNCQKRLGSSAARAGKVNRDGSYTCYVPRTRTSQPRPRSRPQPQNTGPTSAEVIGAIISGAIQAQQAKKRKKPKGKKPKCHRRPDGKGWDCGAN